MIHVLTVHWKSDKWIDIQRFYLDKHLNETYRIYAFLNYLSEDYSHQFFYSLTEPITQHPIKLNILAEIAKLHSDNPDDILIFLDGDAFPINNIMPFIYEKLEQSPLIAVQRLENNNDIQPHPLFCATTVGFWQEIKGDWNKGYQWQNNQGKFITDVGGNLLKILQDRKINWYPLLRSNAKNYHPVFFAIYGNFIYHHGAGFREASSRYDAELHNLAKSKNSYLSKLVNKIPMNKFTFPLIKNLDPARKVKKTIESNNEEISNMIYAKLKDNPDFYQEMI